MNIGDKVRLIHGREEGVITGISQGNQIEIEIEDGFRIPVLKTEVVVISPIEKEKFTAPSAAAGAPRDTFVPVSRNKTFAARGIFLAFDLVNDRECVSYLINNTDWQLPYILLAHAGGMTTGLSAGLLAPRKWQRIAAHQVKELESWPVFELQALYFDSGEFTPRSPFRKQLRIRAQSFFRKKQDTPLLLKQTFCYQLDEEEPAETRPEISAEQIRARMLDGGTDSGTADIGKAEPVFDLHIEKLLPDRTGLPPGEILGIQLAAFEKQLERAVSSGLDDITFVHGTGNGVLRTELHRRLGKHPNVQFYRDAHKEKFGFGATFVKIK